MSHQLEKSVISPLVEMFAGVDMDCPKCTGKNAHLWEDHTGVFLKCRCGFLKLLQSKYDDGTRVVHIDIEYVITLPEAGSKLRRALGAVRGLEPANTQQITDFLCKTGAPQTTSDVSSQLTILRYKGLVVPVVYCRGVPGGSTWATTEACKRLMGT